MEALQRRFGASRLAVLELGCANGLIGRVLCSPHLVMEHFDALFGAEIQRPAVLAEVAVYRGFDLVIPDEAWLLACLPFASDRQRIDTFLNEVPVGPDFALARGSALDFPDLTGVMDLECRFEPAHVDPLVPVVLTSFLMYQIPPVKRAKLENAITAFVSARGGAWINLDHRVTPDGRLRFGLEMDGLPVFVFNNDACQSWTAE
jgi:hypothetical protein